MKNKDFIHYAKHESGAYMYTTKEPDGDYVLHYLNPHGYEQICGATLEKLQKGTTLQPWYVSDKIYNQLLNEIAAQAKGKTDVSSGDYFAPPSGDSFEDKFKERIKERDKHMKWEDTVEKARKDEDNIVEINGSYIDGIAFKDKKTGEIIEGVETVVPYYYNLFYFKNKHAPMQYLGYSHQGEWRPEGSLQTDIYALLNAVLESIDKEVEQDKKEEREAEGLPEQDTYETGLMDGKKSAQEEQKKPRFRITLEANNEALLGSKLINDGSRSKVVQETNEETADELLRMFVEAVKGVGFQEPTVHQTVIELADEFSRYDTPNGTLHEKAQQFADEMGSQEAYDWYLSVYEFNH